jgi:adenine-specific DNA-methyltransferase
MPDSNFNNPKPVEFIKQLLSYSTSGDDIILDSFAGSGTTAQAVLELNKEDEGNRKFILVEMEDYADTITAERARRVIKGVPTAKNELVKKGLGGSFSYFELGDAIEMESLLAGKTLPSYEELGRYLFYTATGEEFKQDELDESSNYVGMTDQFNVYMYYKPDLEYLKTTALTLDIARALREKTGSRPLLVFAPTKYVEQQTLDELNITFCQLPFEIYRLKN